MSYLDNLENQLKSLESREDGAESAEREQERRLAERQRAQAAAPYLEKLKSGPYTADLLNRVTRLGFERRTKVHIAWMGNILMLEAKNSRMELRPLPEGVVAFFLDGIEEIQRIPVDLDSSAEDLARRWVGVWDPS
jgi:hypothetical protein